MSPDYEQYQIIEYLLADEPINFNMRLSAENSSPIPRKLTLLNSSPSSKTIISGIEKNKEQELVGELSQIQIWETVADFLSIQYEVYSIKARLI